MFQPNLVQVKHSWFLLTTAAEKNSVFSSLRLVQSYSAFVGSCSFSARGPRGDPVPVPLQMVPGHCVGD